MNRNLFVVKILVVLFFAFLAISPLLSLGEHGASVAMAAAGDECGEGFEKQGALCVPVNPFNGPANSLVAQTTATGLIATVIRILLYFAGIIAVLFLIIGGYYYLTSRGNEEQATKGRQTLVYALLGLSIVILSYVIVSVVTNQLTSNI